MICQVKCIKILAVETREDARYWRIVLEAEAVAVMIVRVKLDVENTSEDYLDGKCDRGSTNLHSGDLRPRDGALGP